MELGLDVIRPTAKLELDPLLQSGSPSRAFVRGLWLERHAREFDPVLALDSLEFWDWCQGASPILLELFANYCGEILRDGAPLPPEPRSRATYAAAFRYSPL